MKRLIVTFILVFLSIGICISTSLYVSSVANKAQNYVSEAEKNMNNNQYRAALGAISSFEDYWENNQVFLATILHHELLEEIDKSIASMKYSLKHPDKEFSDFWNELAKANKKIENLKKCEIPSLENIL